MKASYVNGKIAEIRDFYSIKIEEINQSLENLKQTT